MKTIKLENLAVDQKFILEGEEYKLLNHDNSGSLSAGPACERVRDGEVICFSYINWSKDAKATMVEVQ